MLCDALFLDSQTRVNDEFFKNFPRCILLVDFFCLLNYPDIFSYFTIHYSLLSNNPFHYFARYICQAIAAPQEFVSQFLMINAHEI